MRVSFRAELDWNRVRRLSRSVRPGMAARAHDAAGLDHVDSQFFSAGEHFGRFRAGIKPELVDTFPSHLIEQLEADFRRYVKAYLVERGHWEGVEILKSGQAFDLLERRMDGKDDPARVVKCPNRFVHEFRPVGAGTDHSDRFGGQMSSFRVIVRQSVEPVRQEATRFWSLLII
jgi:hypothetical protein